MSPTSVHPPPPPDDRLLTRRAALARAAALLGGTLAAPTIAGVLAGCGDVPARPGAAGAASTAAAPLRALTADQERLVAAAAEAILPATNTPGARDAGVSRFVDRMLADYYPAEERARFVDGLAELDVRARRRHGQAFLACTPAEQYAVVDALDAEAFPEPAAAENRGANAGVEAERQPDTRAPAAGAGQAQAAAAAAAPDAGATVPNEVADRERRTAFYRKLKELTLVGYYTSQAGATRELRVNPMGRWRADVPYGELGAGWA